MALIVDEKGNMFLTQGDSGYLTVDGINTDKNYKVFFAVQDVNRKPIGIEPYVYSDYKSSVVIDLPSQLTDLLTVKKDEEFAEYYYGIKVCDEATGYEDTLVLGDGDIGDLNTITVYPKKVEGI